MSACKVSLKIFVVQTVLRTYVSATNPEYPLMLHAEGVDVLDTALQHQWDYLSSRLVILVQSSSEKFRKSNGLSPRLSLYHIWSRQSFGAEILRDEGLLEIIVLGALLNYPVVDDDQLFAHLNNRLLQLLQDGCLGSLRIFLFLAQMPAV